MSPASLKLFPCRVAKLQVKRRKIGKFSHKALYGGELWRRFARKLDIETSPKQLSGQISRCTIDSRFRQKQANLKIFQGSFAPFTGNGSTADRKWRLPFSQGKKLASRWRKPGRASPSEGRAAGGQSRPFFGFAGPWSPPRGRYGKYVETESFRPGELSNRPMHREAVSGSVYYVLPPSDELYTIQPGGPYSPIGNGTNQINSRQASTEEVVAQNLKIIEHRISRFHFRFCIIISQMPILN